MKKSIILFFVICFSSQIVNANYFAGGSISYQALGSTQYLISMNIIRDCSGGFTPNSFPLTVASNTCGYSQTYTLLYVPGGYEITPPCPQGLTTCNGGTEPGFQFNTYSCVVNLPFQCADWIFSVQGCCRADSLTTIQPAQPTQSFYLEAALNNIGQDNSSSQSTNVPLGLVCVNQSSTYNFGIIDPEGDSLSFSLVDAQTGPNGNVIYNTGFSGSSPGSSNPPLTINSITGDIQMNIFTNEYSVIAVRIDEYRNGVIVGYTLQNVAVLSRPCILNPPMINCPTQIINIEATEQFCYDFITSDNDPDDTLTLTCNNSSIPGSVFTATTNPFPIGQFCWTPSVSDTSTQPYFFTVTVRDNDCPSNIVVTCQVELMVSPYTATDNIEDKIKIKLSPNPATDYFKIENSNSVQLISIKNLLGASMDVKRNNYLYDVSGLPAGIYIVKVQLMNGKILDAKLVKN